MDLHPEYVTVPPQPQQEAAARRDAVQEGVGGELTDAE